MHSNSPVVTKDSKQSFEVAKRPTRWLKKTKSFPSSCPVTFSIDLASGNQSITNAKSSVPSNQSSSNNNAPEDFSFLDSADLQDVVKFKSRVCMYGQKEHVFFLTGPADYYLIHDLRRISHSFENMTEIPYPLMSSKKMVFVPPMDECISDAYTIVRSDGDSGLFDSHFDDVLTDVSIHFPFICRLIRMHGKTNPTRDASSRNKLKCRLDFGCAGDGWLFNSDGEKERPLLTYGFDVFDKVSPTEREAIMSTYASILDAMQDIHDQLEVEYFGNELPYNFPPRTDEYGSALARAIGSERSRTENVTTQLKCLSDGDITDLHEDDRNCLWTGYTKTSGLCVAMKCSATNKVYSLKFILNSRKRVGEYYGETLALEPILARIRSHIQSIDNDYALIHRKQRLNSEELHQGFVVRPLPTHSSYHDLVLDDCIPWTETNIGGNVTAPIISMTANIDRCFFLSPACTVVHQVKQRLAELRPTLSNDDLENRIIELALICGYQTFMPRICHVGMNHIDDLLSVHPSIKLVDLLESEFNSLTGSLGCRRMSPTGVNFKKTFLNDRDVVIEGEAYKDDHGEMNGVMPFVVRQIKLLLRHLNELVTSNNFDQVDVEKVFRKTVQTWSHLGVDIGEFRLMIVVQILILCGVSCPVTNRNKLNVVYPVAGLGAANQLADIERHLRPMITARIAQEFNLQKHGANAVECCLCETSRNRLGEILDYFIKGQSLFYINSEGLSLVKQYGSNVWMPV